jgi:CRISPR/Cas system-associated exonuclease Cas4 (RecB family)
MYAWLYLKGRNQAELVESGLISFRHLREGILLLTSPEGSVITNENIIEFESQLHRLTADILSEETVFSQTEDSTMCKFCTFNKICRRQTGND